MKPAAATVHGREENETHDDDEDDADDADDDDSRHLSQCCLHVNLVI